MIAVIDYQAGNLQSVLKALDRLGVERRLADRPSDLDGCDRILLPGVGAFGAAMAYLDRSGLAGRIRDWLMRDRPFLGICLGMQMLFDGSEEDPAVPGLGFFSGPCLKFRSGKVPQIGWNDVRTVRPSALLGRLPAKPFFYFLHSFYARPDEPSIVSGVTDYGEEFPSIVERGRVCGVQFHPEKSGDAGIEMIRRWAVGA